MKFKDLLIHVTGSPGPELPAAIELARRHGAQVAALHVMDVPTAPVPMDMGVATYSIADQRTACRQLADEAREVVESVAKRESARVDWLVEEGDAVRHIARHAHACDLVVLSISAERNESLFNAGLVEHAVLQCGKPVLAIPSDYEHSLEFNRVVVAWDGSREAARAVTDALPILRDAEHVSVVVVDPKGLSRELGESPGSDICRYLARHGVDAQPHVVDGGDQKTGAAIVEWASNDHAQLIVMGAFGHWRLRELVLGGATRDILRDTPVPVLMSH